MEKNLKHLFVWCITWVIISGLTSCYPTGPVSDPYIVAESRQKENLYYVPSPSNSPLHSKKGDMNFSLMRIAGSKFSGGEMQASFMPASHFGIMGSYSFTSNSGSNTDYIKYNRFELGSGFVTQLSKNWHFETYAGFGNGKIFNQHATGSSRINLTHFFLQPAIAVNDEKKNIQFGFVSKFAGVNFKVVDTSFNTDREPFSASQLNSLYNQPFHLVWEPGFVFRFGWKNFQFHTGYSFSTDLTNADLYKVNGIFSAGICVRFNANDKK
jgi:hypothetical protein